VATTPTDPFAGVAMPAAAAPSPAPVADPFAHVATPASSSQVDPFAGVATPASAQVADPFAGVASPVDSGKGAYVEDQLAQSKESIPDKIGDTIGGIGQGISDFVTQTVPGVAEGAYGLATNPNLTPTQKVTAGANTALANLVGLPRLIQNAGTGAANMATGAYRSLTGNPESDDEMRSQYGKWYDTMQEQAAERQRWLQGGVAGAASALEGRIDPTLATPASALPQQEQLSPLLDVTNLAPLGAGAASRLGATLWKSGAQQIDKTLAQKILAAAGTGLNASGDKLEAVRAAIPHALTNLGISPEIAEKISEPEKLALIVGILGGGIEHGAAVLAGEALPSALQQSGNTARAASNALAGGEGTTNFFERMSRTTTGVPQAIFKALDDTGIGNVLTSTGKLAGATLHGGLVNPFIPLQFLAANGDMNQFGQELGQNLGFAGLGATAIHPFADQSAAAIAARNLADRMTFIQRMIQHATQVGSTADEQVKLYNDLHQRDPQAAQLVASFAATRPDVVVKLDPTTGASSAAYESSIGKRVVVLNPMEPKGIGAQIAAHEITHVITMLPDVAQKLFTHLLGNKDLKTPGMLGQYSDAGQFQPNAEFNAFINRYTAALGKHNLEVPFSPADAAARRVPYDSDAHIRYLANEFTAESLAPYLAGQNSKGESAFSYMYRRNDALSKLVGSTAERLGAPGIREYLDRKYAQGRIAPRFGAAEAAKAYGDKKMSGLIALGLEASRIKEPTLKAGEKPEYVGAGEKTGTTYNFRELQAAPQVATKIFGVSNDLVFDENGKLIGQRPAAAAAAMSRKQAKAVFDALVGQDESKLPDGAIRSRVETDAKGKTKRTLQGRFLADEQLAAIARSNAFNKWQIEAFRKLNEAMKNPQGQAFDLIYQTAGKKGRYATLGSSERTIVPFLLTVTRDNNITVTTLDLDQFHKNYHDAVDALTRRGGKIPIQPQDVAKALSDYLQNQDSGYTGQGLPADPAHPPTGLPARTFSLPEKNFLNELFGISTKDNAGANPYSAQLVEDGQKRSNSAVKAFRLDRMNDLQPTGQKMPFSYPKAKMNFSPKGKETETRHMGRLPVVFALGSHQRAVSFDEDSHKLTLGKKTVEEKFQQAQQNRRLMYSPSGANGAHQKGDDEVRRMADSYRETVPGLPTPHQGYAKLIPELSKRVADAYDALKSNPRDPAVQASYRAFMQETANQWSHAVDAGYTFEPWTKPGQPYANSREMTADVRDNKHLYYFPTLPEGTPFHEFGSGDYDENHPLLKVLQTPDGHAVMANDAFRAVHDLYGHAQNGHEFGPRGELNAFLDHRAMFSDAARPAMTSETMGQNSWVNFGKHLRNADGEIPARGEEGFVHPKDRPFAEQKAALLPPKVQGAIDKAYSPSDEYYKKPYIQGRYGAWLDRSGNTLPMGENEDHESAAMRYLQGPENGLSAAELKKMNSAKSKRDQGIESMNLMFERGHVRVVNGDSQILTNGDHALTPSQNKVLKSWGEDTGKEVIHEAVDANRVKYVYQPPHLNSHFSPSDEGKKEESLKGKRGAWLDRSGNPIFLKDKDDLHARAAERFLESEESGKQYPNALEELFRRGYARIVNTDHDEILSNSDHALSLSQKNVLKKWGEDLEKQVIHDDPKTNRIQYLYQPPHLNSQFSPSDETKVPFEVATHQKGAYPDALHEAEARLRGSDDQDPIRSITHKFADALSGKLSGLLGTKVKVQSVRPAVGGWFNPETNKTEVSPNIVVTLASRNSKSEQVADEFMRAITVAAHQSQGNVFRVPGAGEKATNGALTIGLPASFSEEKLKALMEDLATIKDSANLPLLGGFSLFPNGERQVMVIGDQFYTPPEGSTFRRELAGADKELDKHLANYTIPKDERFYQPFNITTFDNPEGRPGNVEGESPDPADATTPEAARQESLQAGLSRDLDESLRTVEPNYRSKAFSPGSSGKAAEDAGGVQGRDIEGTGPERRASEAYDKIASTGLVSPEYFFQSYLKDTGQDPGSNDSDALLKWAAQTGKIIKPSDIRALEPYKAKVATVEHSVYINPDDKSVIKVVKPGKWGIAGSDLAYFKNLRDMNLLTGGKLNIQVLGIVPHATWPSVVTKMNFVEGTHPTTEELWKYLEDRDFEMEERHRWGHFGSDVEMWDAHRGNWIKLPNGTMIPIDLHLKGDLRPSNAPRFTGAYSPSVAVVPERFTGTGEEADRQSTKKETPKFMQGFNVSQYEKGGKYFDAETGDELTGKKYSTGTIDVSSGKPKFTTDKEANKIGEGPVVRTNLFKQSAGWKWTSEDPPKTQTLVSVENSKGHVYALKADFTDGVELARYPDKTSEPRLRPTGRGAINPGEVAGTIDIRGKEHPVYDQVQIGKAYSPGITEAAARAAADPELQEKSKALDEDFYEKFWPKLIKKTGLNLKPSLQNLNRAAEHATTDLNEWLQHNPKYLDYYHTDWAKTKEIVREEYPEMTDDQFTAFRLFTGLMSPKTPLAASIRDAANLFHLVHTEGNIRAMTLTESAKGNRQAGKGPFVLAGAAAPNKLFASHVLQDQYDKLGSWEKVKDFMSEGVNTAELQKFNKEAGFKSSVSDLGNIRRVTKEATGQDKLIPRMFIFGPKVGAYTLNCIGDDRFTTTDIWEGRFIRSHFPDMFKSGTGLPVNVEEHELFQSFAKKFNELFQKKTGLNLSPSALQAARWFYMIEKSAQAGYRHANTSGTISENAAYALEGIHSRFNRGKREPGPEVDKPF
jgi:hypothetical protein